MSGKNKDIFFDSHAHLEWKSFNKDRDDVVRRAQDAGVGYIISVGTNLPDCRRVIKIADSYPLIYASLGIHPHDADTLDNRALDELRDLSRHPRAVALGEMGLDFYRNLSPRQAQFRAFEAQLELARELEMPAVIHCRDAHPEVMDILSRVSPLPGGGVIHCFSGDVALARKYLDLGWHLSFTGTVTYPKSTTARDVIAFAPLEKMMIETDCPFLTPQQWRGKRNEPAYVVKVAEAIAKIKELTVSDVSRITTLNAKRLYNVDYKLGPGKIAYRIRRSLYLNITNRCTNACVFCAKRNNYTVKGHYLKLDREPSVAEIMAAVEPYRDVDEVVFCGFGEPLLRLDAVLDVAGRLKSKGYRVRVDTDGLASLVHGANVPQKLAGLVDAVSVSLNAHDAATYASICPSKYKERAYEAVMDFIRQARLHIPEVTATVVGLPQVDADRCRRIAKEELGVDFRLRPFNEVG